MVVVYANIIDVIGKRLYSGNIVWVREYVQNAFDANANNVLIRITGNDITIEDDGEGMGLDEVNDQLFSLGGSVKTQEKIGQFGIGAYAGTGICEILEIITKKKGSSPYLVTLDMKKYTQIIENNKLALFDDVVKEIYFISKDKESEDGQSSFTKVRFINVNTETINQITDNKGKKLREVLEDYVPLELDDNFPHKNEIEEFLAQDDKNNKNRSLKVTLELEGELLPIRKYINRNFEFLPLLITKNIENNDGEIIAKLWALYSANGKSLKENASFILRYKGVAVGGHDVLVQFGVKDTKRFIGEIVVCVANLELNTQRFWFVETPLFLEFKNKTLPVLKRLYDIANFDSNLGNGLLNKINRLNDEKNKLLDERYKGNTFNVKISNEKIKSLEREVNNKVSKLRSVISNLENGSNESHDEFYEQVLQVITAKVIDRIPELEYETKIETPPSSIKPWNKYAYVRSLLEKYVVSDDLVTVASHKNSKDTLNNVFTLIETILKEKVEIDSNRHKGADFWNLVKRFIEMYQLPTFVDLADKESYSDAFLRFMTGAYGIFRNPGSHTFIEHYKDERYNIQFLILGELLLGMIESWGKKDEPDKKL